MRLKNLNTYVFFGLLIAISAVGFLLFIPFLSAIFVAALLASIFDHPRALLAKTLKGYPGTVSALMCLVVAVLIVAPVIGIGTIVYNQVTETLGDLATTGSQAQIKVNVGKNAFLDSPIGQFIEGQLPNTDLRQGIGTAIQNAGNNFLDFMTGSFGSGASEAAQALVKKTYQGVAGLVIWMFVMFFTLFYFFIDGRRFIRRVMYLSPLKDEHEELLISKFLSMARATLKGTFIIGGVQATIGGLAFLIAGIASPMLWTVLMVFLAIVPALGAGLIIFPAGVFMLIIGSTWQGFFLLAIGVIVSSIDNVMRPKLVGNDTQMHSLLVFFGTIGGLSVFGIIGFIVGPIILALTLALWHIYATEFKTQIEKFNG